MRVLYPGYEGIISGVRGGYEGIISGVRGYYIRVTRVLYPG